MRKLNEAIEQVTKVLLLLKELEEQEVKQDKVRIGDLKPMEKFKTEIGNFIVLDQDAEHGWTKVLQENFFESDVEFDSEYCDYTKSDLKDKFDGEITTKYTEIFGDALVEHEVNLKSVDMQDYRPFSSRVRPITFEEARQYNDLLVKKDIGDYWWTCTPWSTAERGWKYSVAVVSPSGNFYVSHYDVDYGVRPVCILKSDLFVSKVEE